MLSRLLGLVLLVLGWAFLRRLRPGPSGSGPGTQPGSARQVLTEGKSVLADTATELKGAASEVREVVANVVRNTRDSAADKADRLRSAAPTSSSRGTVGIPTTEQPPDDALFMQDVAPARTPPLSEIDAPTYAADATGPDVPFADPIPGEVVDDSDHTARGDAPDPLVTQSETTHPDTGTQATDSQVGATTEVTQPGMSGTCSPAARQPVTSSYITFTSDDDPASAVTQDPSATTGYDTSGDTLDTTAGATWKSVDEAQSAADATSAGPTNGEDTDATPEGLLIAPEGGSALARDTDDTIPVQRTDVQQSSTDDAGVPGPTAEGDTSSADDPAIRRDRGRIEGGSGERIYLSEEPRGPDDTEDTADSVGKPGPVADARREELQSVHITPETGASTADYQAVEVSLPPETLAAMESMDEHGPAQTVDYPIQEGYTVESTDGKVGSVSSVVRVDGAAENYMVVKEGLILKKEVNIPFSAVDRVEGNTVYLMIDKQYIKLMEGQETIHTGDVGTTL